MTTRVAERDIRIDEQSFFAFAASAKGPHTAWLREIGRAHQRGELPRFSFKIFEGAKVVGYESNPELHVVLKAIEAHMKRSKKHAFGHAQLHGEADTLPRTILLDYFRGTLSFTYPVWHALDLSAVELDLPARAGSEGVELGIGYVLTGKSSRSARAVIRAAGVAATTLYEGFPSWMRRKGRTRRYASRAEALEALARWLAKQQRAGLELRERAPLADLRRSAKGKFPAWSFG